MAQRTPKHTQAVSGWAVHDTSGKITPYTFKRRSGIDPIAATFAGAALPVKMPSKGFENSIEVPSCCSRVCGCSPCDCKPECHCEGPSEGSKKSIEAEREDIHPKLEKSIEASSASI